MATRFPDARRYPVAFPLRFTVNYDTNRRFAGGQEPVGKSEIHRHAIARGACFSPFFPFVPPSRRIVREVGESAFEKSPE